MPRMRAIGGTRLMENDLYSGIRGAEYPIRGCDAIWSRELTSFRGSTLRLRGLFPAFSGISRICRGFKLSFRGSRTIRRREKKEGSREMPGGNDPLPGCRGSPPPSRGVPCGPSPPSPLPPHARTPGRGGPDSGTLSPISGFENGAEMYGSHAGRRHLPLSRGSGRAVGEGTGGEGFRECPPPPGAFSSMAAPPYPALVRARYSSVATCSNQPVGL